MESYGGNRTLPNMRRLIDEMAEYYGTTKTMARSRLIDFGYNEARGILRMVGGNLAPSYISTLSKNETYSISEKAALEEYLRNPSFREILSIGKYLYIAENSCYCLNHSRYIYLDHLGRPHLRQYAREHMNECCLVFKEEYESVFIRFVNGVLQKGTGRGRKRIQYVGINGESPITEGVNVHVNDRQKELLSYLIQDPGYTVSQLSDIMQVSRKTVAGHLKALKDKRIIERIGSARNGYWKIVD